MEKFKPVKPVVWVLYSGNEITFNSIKEASVKSGISRNVISKMCNDHQIYKYWKDGSYFRFLHDWHKVQNIKIKQNEK